VESTTSEDHSDRTGRHKWSLSQEAFDKLLTSFNPDREVAGAKYVELRSNLTRFFEWRGCLYPEDHADETINRVARRIVGGEEVREPSKYSFGVARLLLLEVQKEALKERTALRELPASQQPFESGKDSDELKGRVESLEECLKGLSTDNRELILQYYQGEKSAKIENRRKLTDRFKVPLNVLRMRALRLREKLMMCVEDRLKKVPSKV